MARLYEVVERYPNGTEGRGGVAVYKAKALEWAAQNNRDNAGDGIVYDIVPAGDDVILYDEVLDNDMDMALENFQVAIEGVMNCWNTRKFEDVYRW